MVDRGRTFDAALAIGDYAAATGCVCILHHPTTGHLLITLMATSIVTQPQEVQGHATADWLGIRMPAVLAQIRRDVAPGSLCAVAALRLLGYVIANDGVAGCAACS